MKKTLFPITVVVHDGIFHAHDVFVVALFMAQYGEDNVRYIRTRNKESLAYLFDQPSHVMYDVGMEINPECDHHNWRGFKDLDSMFPMELPVARRAYLRIILESIAKIDCGEEATDYVSSYIKAFNPGWNEKDIVEDLAFRSALSFALAVIEHPMSFILLKSRLTARDTGEAQAQAVVEKAYITALTEGKNYLVLPFFCPWHKALFDMENKHETPLSFVVYPDKVNGFRVQAVPTEYDGFTNRIDIEAVAGEAGCTFVHPSKFIAGFEDIESAITCVERLLS